MFKDIFQTEHLIAKNTGITVRMLEHYFFEPLMFDFKIRFFIIVIEIYLLFVPAAVCKAFSRKHE